LKFSWFFINKYIVALSLMTSSFAGNAVEGLSVLNEHWLLSDQQGLVQQNLQGQQQLLVKGQFEQLDLVKIDSYKHLLAAVNSAQNSLDLYLHSQAGTQLISRLPQNKAALEGVCLYQNPHDKLVYAFVLAAHQPVEQRLVYDLNSHQPVDRLVRHLPISEGVTSCSVDQQKHKLYVAEESIGIWAFDAKPEAQLQRQAVAMLRPFGQLKSEIKGIQVLEDGSLLISQPETDKLALYRETQQKLTWLSAKADSEFVAAFWRTDKQLMIGAGGEQVWSQQSISLQAETREITKAKVQISAKVETKPVQRFGDAADDPAIWINTAVPEKSLILGTDKKSGLAVYNLKGELKQFLASGRLNNVDLRQDLDISAEKVSIVAASNRDFNSISLYKMDKDGVLIQQPDIKTTLKEVYGLCMYHAGKSNRTYVYINDKDGSYQQYELLMNSGHINGKLVREFKLADQPEGCVANDATGELFVGVEDAGIWKLAADPQQSSDLTQVDLIGDRLKDDVEGLALYQNGDKSYLLVSSQGDDSYAIYSAVAPYQYLGSFQIKSNVQLGIDGASETDGLEVTSANLGGDFSHGLLVVQDGHNVMPVEPQNFKLVSFKDIAERFGLTLR